MNGRRGHPAAFPMAPHQQLAVAVQCGVPGVGLLLGSARCAHLRPDVAEPKRSFPGHSVTPRHLWCMFQFSSDNLACICSYFSCKSTAEVLWFRDLLSSNVTSYVVTGLIQCSCKPHKATFQLRSQIWEFISSDGLKSLDFSGIAKGHFFFLCSIF